MSVGGQARGGRVHPLPNAISSDLGANEAS